MKFTDNLLIFGVQTGSRGASVYQAAIAVSTETFLSLIRPMTVKHMILQFNYG